jgi:hypothetical protein
MSADNNSTDLLICIRVVEKYFTVAILLNMHAVSLEILAITAIIIIIIIPTPENVV